MSRTGWKQFKKKKGKLQKKRIMKHNCGLDTTQQRKSYKTDNPETRRQNREKQN